MTPPRIFPARTKTLFAALFLVAVIAWIVLNGENYG